MRYHHFAPNGWYHLRTADQKMHDAFDAQRKAWYGLGWYLLDWWGLPIRTQPILGRK